MDSKGNKLTYHKSRMLMLPLFLAIEKLYFGVENVMNGPSD